MKWIVGIGLWGISLCLPAMLAIVHAHDPVTTRVTWTREISRIVQARCVTCHSPDGPGPMSLATYEEARPWARAIKEEVMTRRMPKWQAVRGYGDFSNDPSLSPFEIALVSAWADGGAPRGEQNESSPAARAVAPPNDGGARVTAVPCGDHALPPGTLLAVEPRLDEDHSLGIAVRFPDGRREIVAWIRGYDPDFPTTYRLRRPLDLPPGTTLVAEPRARCTISVTIAGPR